MIGGGIITACYWGDNGQTQGIGEDQVGTGGTTQVTDGNWSGAKDAMNAALQSAGSEWRYELTGVEETVNRRAGKVPPETEYNRSITPIKKGTPIPGGSIVPGNIIQTPQPATVRSVGCTSYTCAPR